MNSVSTTDKAAYISLTQAAEHSPYTQEYLSLRARQGKLRAVKRGRNWVTTLGWLDDYLQQVDDAKTELKAVQVYEPTVDKDFDYHPAALKRDRDEAPILGAFVHETAEPVVFQPSAHWQKEKLDEPVIQLSDHAHFKTMQSKVDARMAEEPAFSLAIDETPVAMTDAELDEIDVFDAPPEATTWPADTADIKPVKAVSSFKMPSVLRPMAMAAAIFVLFFSMAIVDNIFSVHQNVLAGIGATINDAGQSLIAVGKERQAERTLIDSPQYALVQPVDASEINASAGKVAGVTNTHPSLSTNPIIYTLQVIGIGVSVTFTK